MLSDNETPLDTVTNRNNEKTIEREKEKDTTNRTSLQNRKEKMDDYSSGDCLSSVVSDKTKQKQVDLSPDGEQLNAHMKQQVVERYELLN